MRTVISSTPMPWAIVRYISSGALRSTTMEPGSSPGVSTRVGRSPRLAYTVKVARSTMVITVSRCICARALPISTAITRSTRPLANSLEARRSRPWGEVLSETPTRTEPLPMTSTSPPSTVAVPAASPSHQNGKSCSANIGCQV